MTQKHELIYEMPVQCYRAWEGVEMHRNILCIYNITLLPSCKVLNFISRYNSNRLCTDFLTLQEQI